MFKGRIRFRDGKVVAKIQIKGSKFKAKTDDARLTGLLNQAFTKGVAYGWTRHIKRGGDIICEDNLVDYNDKDAPLTKVSERRILPLMAYLGRNGYSLEETKNDKKITGK